jgi:hypothetical protein
MECREVDLLAEGWEILDAMVDLVEYRRYLYF